MSIPKWNASTQEATISMMELRAQPGEVMDFIVAGGTVHVTRSGKNVATITPHKDAFFQKFATARRGLLRTEGKDNG